MEMREDKTLYFLNGSAIKFDSNISIGYSGGHSAHLFISKDKPKNLNHKTMFGRNEISGKQV